ncbi:MAG: hypothetical protein NXI09_00555 [Bacteroidetes bacterium]|nr:hypothetical protein [Bacteroidota bacterium]
MKDSLFDLFKSKGFWIVIVIGSILGALTSLSIGIFVKKPPILGYGYICPKNTDFKHSLPIIVNPEDSVGFYDYSNLMSGNSNRARFKGVILPIGGQVAITAVDSMKRMTKVLSLDGDQSGWVFSEDLQNEACK